MKGSPAALLVLCADDALRDSLLDLLAADSREVTAVPPPGSGPPVLVVAACDSWPEGWDLRRLRASFRRVPCLVLSGSPLGGDFAVSRLERGYFVQLPVHPADLLGLIADLVDD